MPSTNAERQRQYRVRALKDPDGLLLTRLQVMLSPKADGALQRIIAATGKSKRDVIEEALLEIEKTLQCNDSLRTLQERKNGKDLRRKQPQC